MKTIPKISVIVPAYNEEKLVQRCIRAIIAQQYPQDQFEIILVDNLSTDKTKQKGQEAGAHLVVDCAEKQGVGTVRNAGVAQAQGQIVAFIDSDSFPAPDWLAQLDQRFNDPKCMSVGGIGVPDEDRALQRVMFRLYDYFLRFHQRIGRVLPWGFNLAVRKEAFVKVGGFTRGLRTSEDWDLAMKLQKQYGKSSVIYDPHLVVYTSIRKQAQAKVFFKYLSDGIKNYVNVVILKKAAAATPMFDVR